MEDEQKTKTQLINELAGLRQRIAELESSETERKRAEEELSVAYDALDSSVNAVIIGDLKGKIRYANPAFLKMFEYEDRGQVIGRRAAELFPSETVQSFSDVTAIIDKAKGETEEFLALRKDGTVFNVEISSSVVTDNEGNDVGRMAAFVDITERKQMEERLVRTERLAAIGQLASSVGHELRNPLGVISNSTYYLNTKLKDADGKITKHVSIIQREVGRANKIISDLLDFSKAKPPSLEEGDMNTIIRDTLGEIKVPENISVKTHLNGKLPRVLLDPDQIRQVFLNIVSNALQVMPEGGRLDIKTGVKGHFAEITFKDTGEGIPEDNLKKVFNPLFTTKAKGIGLGLSIVKGIVEGHKGRIEVKSKLGKGTTFIVKLPLGSKP